MKKWNQMKSTEDKISTGLVGGLGMSGRISFLLIHKVLMFNEIRNEMRILNRNSNAVIFMSIEDKLK